MMENHDNEVKELEIDSLTKEDDTLSAPAVEPTAEEQAEHDASFSSGDSISIEIIEDAVSESNTAEDSTENDDSTTVSNNAEVGTSEKEASDSLIDSIATRVMEMIKMLNVEGADSGKEIDVEDNNDASGKEEVQAKDESKEEKEEGKINLDKTLSAEDRSQLEASVFCGPDRTYPVIDKSHAVAALSRAKQHASANLYRKIRESVCKKSDQEGWGLPPCTTDSEWTSELREEASQKEALVMGWDNNVEEELKTDYTNALSRIEDLEKKLSQTLNYLRSEVNKDISLQKEDSKLADMVKWFDSIVINNTAEPAEEEKVLEAIDNPSIASTDSTSTPTTSVGSKKLGAFEKKVVETYSKLLEKDGLNFAENYLKGKRRYLRRGFHPKNYIQLGD